MPYQPILEQLDFEKSDHYWQIRVHINPSAIDESNPQNKIAELNAILKEVFKSDAVDVKLFQITPTDIADENNSYDGAMDHSGKDRTQVDPALICRTPC